MKETNYAAKHESIIGATSHVTGKLRFTTALCIKGKLDGEIISGGDLRIEQESQVLANINVKSLRLHGSIQGNTIADQFVHIHEQAQVSGDITTKIISIAQGAKLKGSINMLSSGENIDIFSAKPEQLKKLLSSQ